DGEHKDVDKVLNVDEVPRLSTVSEDGDPFSAPGAVEEDADDAGVGTRGILARTVDVEEPEGVDGERPAAAVMSQVVLSCQLIDGIRAHRARRRILTD